MSYANVSPQYGTTLATYSAIVEPTSYTKAVKDAKWIEAMEAEISALEKNNTWSIIELPLGKVAIGCNWVLKVKYMASEAVE